MFERIQGTSVFRIFRYVVEFLIFLDYTSESFQNECADALNLVRNCLTPLELTREVPIDGTIRFLDVNFLRVYRQPHVQVLSSRS